MEGALRFYVFDRANRHRLLPMILTDKAILEAMERGEIVVEPFDRSCLGTNSYDVHLGSHLATYRDRVLDARKHNEIEHFDIPEQGFVLEPQLNYLGVTQEYTETHNTVPFLEGKSSVGRLGIDIHATAGKGDVGFCNYWTLEISVKQPVRVYEGMPVGPTDLFSGRWREILRSSTTYQGQSAKYNERNDRYRSSR